MKALVLREHGGDGLRLESGFPDPVLGEGDVVLRVRATALNYHDVFTRRGMPGIRIAMPAIMGLDVAGEIAAIGPGISGWQLGERVLGDPINRVEGGLTGETVVQEGSGGAAFYVIESGEATVFVGGEEYSTLTAGDYFGEIALIDEGARMATITASTDLVCYGLTFWDFRPVVEQNGVIGWKLLQSMAKMYRDARQR